MTQVQQRFSRSVVLLSGGLDSTLALAMTAQEYGAKNTIAVTFDYGQLNRSQEMSASKAVAAHYGVEHRIIGLASAFLPSALTGYVAPIPETAAVDKPDATFVPGRNLVFIGVAVAIAQASGAVAVVVGCNADDYGGYPDCRSNFLSHVSAASLIGYDVTVRSPILRYRKSEIVQLANELSVPTELTWSCYRDGETQCGRCGSCQLNTEAAAL
jgi:7-cyano-7-deazaguanine synthase